MAVGWNHSLGLKADGSLCAWGSNHYGQLGDGTTTDRPSTTLGSALGLRRRSAGDGHSLGMKADGSLCAWGYNSYGQLGDGTTPTITPPSRCST